MDFDIEVMVKLYWSGMRVVFIPLTVLYPEEGKSYFYMFRDNYRITLMHIKLVLGMFIRIPKLIKRNLKDPKWDEANEKGAIWIMKLGSSLYKLLGYRFTRGLCYVISFYYLLLAPKARESSGTYQEIYLKYCEDQNITPKRFSTFRHILSFAHMVVDKLGILNEDVNIDDFYPEDIDQFTDLHKSGEGALFISSHFGNIESIRGLGRRVSDIDYSALIYTKNSKKILAILKSFDPDVEENIIPVNRVGPELGVMLEKKIAQGEWLFCMGDRITAMSDKSIAQTLLGRAMKLPQGPFLLSYILKAPKVYSIHCFRTGAKYRIKIKDITPTIERTRENRDLYVNSIANEYLQDLEQHIIKHPTEWFNFYKYWN